MVDEAETEDLTPYPTQAQNDRAKLGLDIHSEKTEPEEKTETKSSREAKASPSGAGYKTRASGQD